VSRPNHGKCTCWLCRLTAPDPDLSPFPPAAAEKCCLDPAAQPAAVRFAHRGGAGQAWQDQSGGHARSVCLTSCPCCVLQFSTTFPSQARSGTWSPAPFLGSLSARTRPLQEPSGLPSAAASASFSWGAQGVPQPVARESVGTSEGLQNFTLRLQHAPVPVLFPF
jgi:hypothetical protein